MERATPFTTRAIANLGVLLLLGIKLVLESLRLRDLGEQLGARGLELLFHRVQLTLK